MLCPSHPELGRKNEGEVPLGPGARGGLPVGSQAAEGRAVTQHVHIGNVCVHLHCMCMFCQVSSCRRGAGPGPGLGLGLFLRKPGLIVTPMTGRKCGCGCWDCLQPRGFPVGCLSSLLRSPSPTPVLAGRAASWAQAAATAQPASP